MKILHALGQRQQLPTLDAWKYQVTTRASKAFVKRFAWRCSMLGGSDGVYVDKVDAHHPLDEN
jgi:hypothetical protein